MAMRSANNQPRADKALVPTAGATLSAMLSVTFNPPSRFNAPPAPAVGTA